MHSLWVFHEYRGAYFPIHPSPSSCTNILNRANVPRLIHQVSQEEFGGMISAAAALPKKFGFDWWQACGCLFVFAINLLYFSKIWFDCCECREALLTCSRPSTRTGMALSPLTSGSALPTRTTRWEVMVLVIMMYKKQRLGQVQLPFLKFLWLNMKWNSKKWSWFLLFAGPEGSAHCFRQAGQGPVCRWLQGGEHLLLLLLLFCCCLLLFFVAVVPFCCCIYLWGKLIFGHKLFVFSLWTRPLRATRRSTSSPGNVSRFTHVVSILTMQWKECLL